MSRIFPGRDTPIDYLMLLRGCAVIGVLLGHMFGIGTISIGAIATKAQWSYTPHAEPFENWRTALEIVTPLLGMNFVILFFVQSGYLMGKVFFEGRYDATSGKRAFYWARYLRLAPLLYFNLVICIGLYRFANLDPLMMLGDFLFINNFTARGINLVTWSLSHEMQYYLLAPFIFLVFRNLSGRKAVIGAVILVLMAYGVGALIPQWGFMYAFAAGFCVNLLPKAPISTTAKRVGFVGGLLILHFGYNILSFGQKGELAIALAVLISAWLVYVCERPSEERHAPLILRVGVFTGYLTYGIYLWHYPIIMTRSGDFAEIAKRVAQSLHLDLWQTVIVFHSMELLVVLAVSYVLAYATFVLIEARFRPSLYSGLPHSP